MLDGRLSARMLQLLLQLRRLHLDLLERHLPDVGSLGSEHHDLMVRGIQTRGVLLVGDTVLSSIIA